MGIIVPRLSISSRVHWRREVSPMGRTRSEPNVRRQTILERLQENRQCTKVSISRSQIEKFGSTWIPLFYKIDLVGTKLWETSHKKNWTFGGIFNFHIMFHVTCWFNKTLSSRDNQVPFGRNGTKYYPACLEELKYRHNLTANY